MSESNWGGSRPGSGRNPKHDGPVRRVPYSLPVALLERLGDASAGTDEYMVDIVQRAIERELDRMGY